MEIALSTVIEEARQRRAAVTAEVAGYVVLLVAQQASEEPRLVSVQQVQLSAAGDVRLDSSESAPAPAVEHQLRQLLGLLISLAQSSTPALRAAAERLAVGGLEQLTDELSAALIPINHAAARRALARLYRETSKGLAIRPRAESAAPGGVSLSPLPAEIVPAESFRVSTPVAPTAAAISAFRAPSLEPPRVAAALQPEVAPAPVCIAARSPMPDELPELEVDIDVDLDIVEDEPVAEASPASVPVESQRSDVSELVARFLSETRSEQRMVEDLRRMVGLTLSPARAANEPQASPASDHAA